MARRGRTTGAAGLVETGEAAAAADVGVVVGADGAVGIGDLDAVGAHGAHGGLLRPQRVFAGDRAAILVVGEAGVAAVGFVDDAGEGVGLAGAAVVAGFVVEIGDGRAVGVGGLDQIGVCAGAVVGIGDAGEEAVTDGGDTRGAVVGEGQRAALGIDGLREAPGGVVGEAQRRAAFVQCDETAVGVIGFAVALGIAVTPTAAITHEQAAWVDGAGVTAVGFDVIDAFARRAEQADRGVLAVAGFQLHLAQRAVVGAAPACAEVGVHRAHELVACDGAAVVVAGPGQCAGGGRRDVGDGFELVAEAGVDGVADGWVGQAVAGAEVGLVWRCFNSVGRRNVGAAGDPLNGTDAPLILGSVRIGASLRAIGFDAIQRRGGRARVKVPIVGVGSSTISIGTRVHVVGPVLSAIDFMGFGEFTILAAIQFTTHGHLHATGIFNVEEPCNGFTSDALGDEILEEGFCVGLGCDGESGEGDERSDAKRHPMHADDPWKRSMK